VFPSMFTLKLCSMNFWANPVNTINNSGSPSPVFAEVGTIAICFV